MGEISVWGFRLPEEVLTEEDAAYLNSLPRTLPSLSWVWAEMDRIWKLYDLDNRLPLANQAIGRYYCHPVWLMNGIYTASDPVSVAHRDAIARQIARLGSRRVADYGGGFGELALRLSTISSGIGVDIVEPYPAKSGMLRVQGRKTIRYIKDFEGQYDCVIAQDVLEHIEHPLKLAAKMVQATRLHGYLIFANCFYPVIKCHLPSTFYLRHTFPWLMQRLGVRFEGRVAGAEHALVFRKTRENSNGINGLENLLAKIVGQILNLYLKSG